MNVVPCYAPLRRILRRSLLLRFYRVEIKLHQKVETELLGFESMTSDSTTDMLTSDARLRLPRVSVRRIRPVF